MESEKSVGHWPAGLVFLFVLFIGSPAYSQQVTLYFPQHNKSYLGLEKRDINLGASLTEEARNIMLALMDGPQTGLNPIFNPGEHLRQVFIDQAGIAYVDLKATAVRGLQGGVQWERLTLWSMVNSLCLNLDGVNSVEILIDGREIFTLYGHLDLSYPLYPDLSLIK